MASRVASRPPLKSARFASPPVEDNASDSGYGGSIKDDDPLTNLSETTEVFLSLDSQVNQHFTTSKSQELYKENCQLLTASIEDTKHLLKVFFHYF
jgi:hypothetical protein